MSDLPEFLPEAPESGTRKSFWGHLRDLRTALVRSAIAIGLALVVCLLIGDKLVAILEHPLHNIDLFQKPQPSVAFRLGDAQFGPYALTPEQVSALPPASTRNAMYDLGIARVGGEQVVTLKEVPNHAPKGSQSLRIQLHNYSPAEAFFVAFHVALYGAFVIAAPFWIYFMGQFFLPALNVRERRMLFMWLGWGTLLFFTGVLLTYFLLLPIALRASVEYSHLMGFAAHDWRADQYIGFVTKFLLGMGIGFQFPIVVLLLVRLGLVTAAQLAHYRRHVVVFTLIIGALLTTPEVITQVAMAVPLYILYEGCIWIARYWDWKKRRAEAAAG
jgi:sec-independent protein translocase protein TatC